LPTSLPSREASAPQAYGAVWPPRPGTAFLERLGVRYPLFFSSPALPSRHAHLPLQGRHYRRSWYPQLTDSSPSCSAGPSVFNPHSAPSLARGFVQSVFSAPVAPHLTRVSGISSAATAALKTLYIWGPRVYGVKLNSCEVISFAENPTEVTQMVTRENQCTPPAGARQGPREHIQEQIPEPIPEPHRLNAS